MNLKDWKKFSDLVDKHNDLHRKLFSKIGSTRYGQSDPFLLSKSEANFWDWKVGKLKLK